MDKPAKLVIIFSLVGVSVLYTLSVFVNPPLVPLDEVSSHEGAVIRTRGVITAFSLTESGNVGMKIEGNGTELLIFVNSKVDGSKELLNLSYGDELEVEGSVEVYQGEYELIVSGNGIKKLTSGSTISFVAQIAVDPEAYKGRKIQVAGYVEDVYQRVFYLRDETGTYHLRVKLVDTDMPISGLQEGAQIIAEGVLAYDAKTMRYELNLVGWKHGE
jgi:DNA/RNA endonuclease YhcR with UshA esterase domain